MTDNSVMLIQRSTLNGIANAIREQTGETNKYYPGEMAAKILGIMGGAKIPSHYINIQQQPNQIITVDTSVGIKYTGSDETSHTESYTTNGNFEYVEVISAKTKAAKGYHRGNIVFTPNTITNGSVLDGDVTVTATPAVEYTYESLNIPTGYTPLFYKLMENGMIDHVTNSTVCTPYRSANIYTDFNCTVPFTPPGNNPEGKYAFFIGKNDDDIDLDCHINGGYTLSFLGKLNDSNVSIIDFSGIDFNRSNPILNNGYYGYSTNLNLSCDRVKEFVNLNLNNYINSYYNGITKDIIINSIQGPLSQSPYTFTDSTNLINAPKIPNGTYSISGIFSNCTSLVNIPEISNSVIDMNGTFAYCSNLTSGIINILPENVCNMSNTFSNCSNLTNISLTVNIKNVPDLYPGATGCYPTAVNMFGTFVNCTNLKDISLTLSCKDTNNWNRAIIAVDTYRGMFNGCNNINNFSLYIDHVNFMYNSIPMTSYNNINIVDNVSPVIPASSYYWRLNIVNATIHFDNATSIDYLFNYSRNLKSVNMYCPNIISMSSTFDNCTVLEGNINVHSNNVTNVYNCFRGHNNSYSVNVYAYSNSTTYNTFKTYLGGTDNSVLNVHLKTF
jgi:hypothetical protein